MEKKQYVCPKCGNHEFVDGSFQATGGNFAKIMNVQNKKFITVSCTQCGLKDQHGNERTGLFDWQLMMEPLRNQRFFIFLKFW